MDQYNIADMTKNVFRVVHQETVVIIKKREEDSQVNFRESDLRR